MKRLWKFFSRMDLGFWLLMCVSLNLFVGVLVAAFQADEYKKLDSILMPAWLSLSTGRPWLYLWIFSLFILLFLLGVNTAVCMIEYMKTLIDKGCVLKKLGIILFHAAFVLAIGGHCISTFTGTNEQVMLDAGTTTQVPGTGLTLETTEIRKIRTTINGEVARLGIEAKLRAVTEDGNSIPMNMETMAPQFLLGYSFHLSFMDKGLTGKQARLIVRRDYGLVFIMLAGIVALIATALYVWFILLPYIPLRR